MERLIVDLSSACWTALFAGTDTEFGIEVNTDGKRTLVNSAQFAYENAIETILAAARHSGGIPPSQFILVEESGNSKGLRQRIFDGYKNKSGDKPKESYEQFNLLKPMVIDALKRVGACVVSQPHIEADDVIAYLVGGLKGKITLVTNDGDLSVLLSERVKMWKGGKMIEEHPFGPFDQKYVRLYKALVGDTSDTYPGAKGFGDQAFLKMAILFGDEGLDAFVDLLEKEAAYFWAHHKVSGEWLMPLSEDVAEFKPLGKVLENIETVVRCWLVAGLYPDKVNTLRQPLQWQAGMVKVGHPDERLKPFSQQVRLITAENYEKACSFLKAKTQESPFFCLDLETTTPEESDEWLAQRSTKGGGVDVIGSTIVGCGLSFGSNHQYGFYCSVDHADTNNITLLQLQKLLEIIPKEKITVAQNAAGFELPVMYNAFGEAWKDNGYRGFFPNMVDSRIAASYWDENQPSHGLKQLSKLLLGYEQETYAEVTGGKKMHELTAQHVLSYGIDDVVCTVGIWNFFRIIMEIEDSFEAFMRIEQKPMYLSALSYVQGTPISLARLFELKKADEATYAECSKVLNTYLIEKGWEGTQCPVIDDLTPATIKEAVLLILGQPLETKVRTIPKLVALVELIEHEDAPMLARLIEQNDLDRINTLMRQHFTGAPEINVGSNKQLTKLMYETMGLPIRLRNKATDKMRESAERYEKVLGNPRADDEAMSMAIKMGDATEDVKPVLEALTAMKSINTRTGLYWNAYPGMVHWKTKRLHPEIRQCATNTRRHTSGNPNIQQLDSDAGGVRSIILPHHKDAVLVSCDLAGQEIRLLGDMCRDDNILSAYVGDDLKDLHSFTAAMILDIPYDEFRSRYKSQDPAIAEEANRVRQSGKICWFASSYGAMAPKIAEGLGITEDLAQSYLDALDRAFPRVGQWKKETEAFALVNGWAPIHGGTRRHLAPLLKSEDKWIAQKALRQASNARIQGAGGNQIRLIMGKIWDSPLLDTYDFRFYWPVHDECVFSVSRPDSVEVIQQFHSIMCQQFLDVLPSASSIGIGKTFGSLVEIGEAADAALISKTLAEIFEVQP